MAFNLNRIFLHFVLVWFLNISLVNDAICQENNHSDLSATSADSLLNLSEKYIGIDNDVARLYARKGFQQLSDTSDKKGLISYYLLNGQISYFEDEYENALIYLDSAKSYLEKDQYPGMLARFYFYNAQNNACIGNFSQAFESCYNSVKIREEINDISGIANCNNYLGALYMNQGDLQKANKHYMLALAKAREAQNNLMYATILSNLGALKMEQDSLNKANDFINQAYEIFLSLGNIRRIASTLTRKAEINIGLGNNSEAINELNEAESLYRKLDDDYGLVTVYNTLGKAYLNLDKTSQALSQSEKANKLAQKIQNHPLLAETNLMLSEIYKKRGAFEKALMHFEQYESLNTELISLENSKQISYIEYQSELASKDKDIKILTQENRLKKQHNLTLIIGLIAVALLSALAIYLLRMKNITLRQRHEILSNKNKINEQEKIILENNLELKNKQLASKALALMQLNETLKEIGNKLNNSGIEKNEKIDSRVSRKILLDIQTASHGNMWKEFDTAFNNVHNEFYDKLFTICPDLSSSEIKLAALLKLNLSTKEIAALTFKSESAIKTARHRLRQKLNLGHNGSLISFLMKL